MTLTVKLHLSTLSYFDRKTRVILYIIFEWNQVEKTYIAPS